MTKAQESFYAKQTEAYQRLAEIQRLLAAFGEDAATHPKRWDYAGTMGQVVEQLKQIEDFLR